jgi:hypothetical protein
MTKHDELVERLQHDAELLEGGPYVGLKSCRENFREAAQAITTLKAQVAELAGLLQSVRDTIESPDAQWWMTVPHRGGFDLVAIEAALSEHEKEGGE